MEIDVWGQKATGGSDRLGRLGRLGRTGRGLTLGGTRRRVEQVYGRRYQVLRPADKGRLALWLAWDEDFSLNSKVCAKCGGALEGTVTDAGPLGRYHPGCFSG